MGQSRSLSPKRLVGTETTVLSVSVVVRQAYSSAEDDLFKSYYVEDMMTGRKDIPMTIPEWRQAIANRLIIESVELETQWITGTYGTLVGKCRQSPSKKNSSAGKVEKEMEHQGISKRDIHSALVITYSIEQSGEEKMDISMEGSRA